MSLNKIIEKLSDVKVLVIGDLMLDHYIWGDAHRISPEAPVPVVNVMRDTYSAGGAANVALNLANLKVQSSVLGYYANDEAGTQLRKILSDKSVSMYPEKYFANAPTIIKTRVLVRNQQLCRIDREVSREHYSIETQGFYGELEKILEQTDAVIISDYAKGVVTQTLIDFVLKIANENSRILVAVDPKPSRKLKFQNAGLLTPNKQEALQLAGYADMSPHEAYPLEDICKKIYEVYNPKLLVITLGADGMAICKNGIIKEVLPTEAREVFDVSGAGDTVIATLTAALASGANAHEAARLANAAAGCVVAHMGTVPVDISELKAAVQNN